MPKSRVHFVRVKVKFDKPIGERKAVAAARDGLSGYFDLNPHTDDTDGAEQFHVGSVVAAKRR